MLMYAGSCKDVRPVGVAVNSPDFHSGEHRFEPDTGYVFSDSDISDMVEAEPPVYRVGRHLGFTLYENDEYIGTMKDAKTAEWIAAELNRLEDLKF